MKELKANLEENGWVSHATYLTHSALATGIQDTLSTRVAEGMVFGRASCQTCSQKSQCQLTYADSMPDATSIVLCFSRVEMFTCKADLQWGTCGWQGIDVEFTPWKYNDAFFADVKHLVPIEQYSRPLKKVHLLFWVCFSLAGWEEGCDVQAWPQEAFARNDLCTGGETVCLAQSPQGDYHAEWGHLLRCYCVQCMFLLDYWHISLLDLSLCWDWFPHFDVARDSGLPSKDCEGEGVRYCCR